MGGRNSQSTARQKPESEIQSPAPLIGHPINSAGRYQLLSSTLWFASQSSSCGMVHTRLCEHTATVKYSYYNLQPHPGEDVRVDQRRYTGLSSFLTQDKTGYSPATQTWNFTRRITRICNNTCNAVGMHDSPAHKRKSVMPSSCTGIPSAALSAAAVMLGISVRRPC